MIGRKLVFVTGPADWRGLHAERRFCGLQNCVRRMAIAADRCFRVPFGYALPVRAALELVVDLGMACAACLWNIRFEGRAVRIFVAQDAMRAVATLAIGSHQQTFFAQRKAVDRIHVVRVDAGQSLSGGHGAITVALSAGLGYVERINRRSCVGLREDLVSITVTTGARMFFRRRVYARGEFRAFVRVAGLAVDFCDVIGVRVFLDVSMAIVALQAAMDAGTELISIDRNAMSCGVLHGLISVTGETL